MPESSKSRKASMRSGYHSEWGRRRKRAKTGQKGKGVVQQPVVHETWVLSSLNGTRGWKLRRASLLGSVVQN